MSAIAHVFPGAVLHPTDYYGYPNVGSSRRVKPTILGVIHTTETSSVPFPQYVVKDGVVTVGKSWTFSVERDGTVHQFMDPVVAAPWTNGDAQSWDTTNPLIVAAAGSGYNVNEFCFITIENVNRVDDGERLTEAQLAANRAILEWGSKLSGLPLDRKHVVGHYQINGVTRLRCPTVPTDRDRVFGGILGQSLVEDAMVPMVFKVQSWVFPAGEKVYASPDRDSAVVATLAGGPGVTVAQWVAQTENGPDPKPWRVLLLADDVTGWVHIGDAQNATVKAWQELVEDVLLKTDLAKPIPSWPLPDTADQSEVIDGLKQELADAQKTAQDAEQKLKDNQPLIDEAIAVRTALHNLLS